MFHVIIIDVDMYGYPRIDWCDFFSELRLPKGDVSVDDAFIVRYATDSQRGLAFHRDGSWDFSGLVFPGVKQKWIHHLLIWVV